MKKSAFNLLDSDLPTFESGNSHFDFLEDEEDYDFPSNFFPIKETTFNMFLEFIDPLFFFLKDQIQLGLLDRPLNDGGRPDFGSFSDQAQAYQIFFSPFRHLFNESFVSEWLTDIHEDILKHETLNDYLESPQCVDAEITLFMLHFDCALNLLYNGRDSRVTDGPFELS